MSLIRSDDPPALVAGLVVGTLTAIALAILLIGCAPSVLDRASEIPHGQATYTPTAGTSMGDAFSDIFTLAGLWGFSVLYSDGDEAYGRVYIKERRIEIRPDLPLNAMFEVMAHELGHIFQPAMLDTSEGEVFAELVLVDVAKFYGFSSSRISAQYLAAHKAAFPSAKYLRTDVKLAVEAITGQRPVKFLDR